MWTVSECPSVAKRRAEDLCPERSFDVGPLRSSFDNPAFLRQGPLGGGSRAVGGSSEWVLDNSTAGDSLESKQLERAMGVGPMSPDGHVASGINVWMLLSTICCVCACISTFFYLRVREKYLQRENEAYARRLRENEETDVADAASSGRGGRPVAQERRDGLEKMLREMQKEVNQLKKAAKDGPQHASLSGKKHD